MKQRLITFAGGILKKRIYRENAWQSRANETTKGIDNQAA